MNKESKVKTDSNAKEKNISKNCDYIFTRGENKGSKCEFLATIEKEGHPRCTKHKNNPIKENTNTKPLQNDVNTLSNKHDIQSLLAKRKS